MAHGKLWHHCLRAFAGLLAVLLLATSAALWWIGQTNSFLRWALARAVAAADGSLHAGDVHGSLLGGFRLDALRWSDEAREVELADLRIRLRLRGLLSGLLRGELYLASIELAKARVILHPDEKDAARESSLPDSLELPFALQLDALAIDQLVMQRTEPGAGEVNGRERSAPSELFVLRQLALAGSYRDRRYEVRHFGFSSPWGTLQMHGSLQARAPYALEFVIGAAPRWASAEAHDWLLPDVQVLVEGTLSDLALAAQTLPATGADAMAQARHPAGWIGITTRIRPFAASVAQMFDPLDVQIDAIEPRMFGLRQLPRMQVSGQARLRLSGEHLLTGDLDLVNDAAGSLRDDRIPVRRARFSFEADPDRLRARDLQLSLLDEARVQADLIVDLDRLRLASARLRSAAGTLEIRGSASLASPWQVDLDGRFSALDPAAFSRMLVAAGLQDDALAAEWSGQIAGTWSARGRAWPDPQLTAQLTVASGHLAGQAMTMDWRADVAMQRIAGVDATIDFGALHARARGALGRASDRLTVSARADALDRIDARASGSISLAGEITGGWLDVPLSAHLKLSANSLSWRDEARAGTLVGQLDLENVMVQEWWAAFTASHAAAGARPISRPSGTVDARWQAMALRAGDQRIDKLRIGIVGDADEHTVDIVLTDAARTAAVRAQGSLVIAPWQKPAVGSAADRSSATGPSKAGWSWSGRLLEARADSTVAAGGKLAARLADAAVLRIDADGFALARSDWRIGVGDPTDKEALADEARLQLESLSWVDGHYSLRGQAHDLPMGAWAGRLALPRDDDATKAAWAELRALLVNVQWDVSGDDPARPSGHVRIDLPGAVRSQEHGRIDLALDEGRLDGRASLHLPTLAFLDRTLGPAWSVAGQVRFDGHLGGTITAPKLDGALGGRSLALTQHELGWRLGNGSLQAEFDGDRLVLRELRLESGDGSIVLQGTMQLDGLDGTFDLLADRLTVPIGPGERLVVSGATMITSRQAILQWRGKLRVDEGLIELRGGEVPTRPADVVIDGDAPAPAETAAGASEAASSPAPPTGLRVLADLELDLGRQLRVRGSGADLQLAGSFSLTGSLPEDPQAHGTVRVSRGTYSAWGQTLEITRGRAIFDGPIDNPVLDIVAVRRGQQVEAGVRVTGTVLAPRVQLISQPEVPDAEKLSWLVLGVGFDDAASGAQMAALQAAAATLLGSGGGSGGLVHALGLDVLTIRGASTGGGLNPDFGARFAGQASTMSAEPDSAGDVLAIGKRLGSRVLVTYEQGLHGVWNLFRIQYAITRRLSLQAQAGTDTALDLLYSFSFDRGDDRSARRRWQR